MANTIQYNSAVMLVGPSPSHSDHVGAMRYLRMIQSTDISLRKNYMELNTIGLRGPLSKHQMVAPEVSCNISYHLSNGVNEHNLGFFVQDANILSGQNITDFVNQHNQYSFCSSLGACGSTKHEDYHVANQIVNRQHDNRNLFLVLADDRQDLLFENPQEEAGAYLSHPETMTVIGLGNCFVNSYSISAQQGKPLLASVEFQGANLKIETYQQYSGYSYPGSLLVTGATFSAPHGSFPDIDGVYLKGSSLYNSRPIYSTNGLLSSPLTNTVEVIYFDSSTQQWILKGTGLLNTNVYVAPTNEDWPDPSWASYWSPQGGAAYLLTGKPYVLFTGQHMASGSIIPAINPYNGQKSDYHYAFTKATLVNNDFPGASLYISDSIDRSIEPDLTKDGYTGVVLPNTMDLLISGEGFGFQSNATHESEAFQSFELSLNMNRKDNYGLGSRYPTDRSLQLPIKGSFTTDLIVEAIQTGDLYDRFNNESDYVIHALLRGYDTGNANYNKPYLQFKIVGAKLESQNFSLAIGNRATMSLSFSFDDGWAHETFTGSGHFPEKYTGVFFSGMSETNGDGVISYGGNQPFAGLYTENQYFDLQRIFPTFITAE